MSASMNGRMWQGMLLESLFGKVLQELRQERGYSQEQLGSESGYHRTYISLLERGRKNPSLKTIFHLAKTLRIDPSELVRRIEARAEIPDPSDSIRSE